MHSQREEKAHFCTKDPACGGLTLATRSLTKKLSAESAVPQLRGFPGVGTLRMYTLFLQMIHLQGEGETLLISCCRHNNILHEDCG